MQDGSAPRWIFLDFDGVVCDSVEECFQASWLTLSGTRVNELTPPLAPFSEEYRRVFLSCRPFIRSGEDYLVLHSLLAEGRPPTSQTEFDRELQVLGRPALDSMKSRLYETREALLSLHRKLWLSWNPLFPGMTETLGHLATKPRVLVLSTKKASFIAEILAHNGVIWPVERIIYSGNSRKLDFVEKMAGQESSLLLDDQIDHLDFQHKSCECVLAGWGYVSPATRTLAQACWDLGQAVDYLRTNV